MRLKICTDKSRALPWQRAIERGLFDAMAQLVGLAVEAQAPFAIGFAGDDRLDAAGFQP